MRHCGMSEVESFSNVVRAKDVVEQIGVEAASHSLEGFGNHIPAIHLVAVAMHGSIEVSFHGTLELHRVGSVDQVVGVAAARDQAMSLDDHIISICKSDKAVESIPVVVAGGWIELSPLQFVLRRKTFELGGEDLGEQGVVEIVGVDCPRSDGDVLSGGFVSE